MALQVCDGLAAIHEAGIIHRDLKPANLMLEPKGLVKVMDFGVAKVGTTLAESHTQTGMVVGTPEYMSPEQVRGGEIDFRSDLYALGVVIYEMFTGRVPFHADTPVGTMLLHLEEPVPLDPAPPAAARAARGRAAAGPREAHRRPLRVRGRDARGARGGAQLVRRARTPCRCSRANVGSGERPTELPRSAASLRPSATLPPEARLLLPMLARALKSPQGDIRLQAARAIALHGRSAALAIPSLQALRRRPAAGGSGDGGPRPAPDRLPDAAAPALPDRPESRPSHEDAASRRPEVRAGPPAELARDRGHAATSSRPRSGPRRHAVPARARRPER